MKWNYSRAKPRQTFFEIFLFIGEKLNFWWILISIFSHILVKKFQMEINYDIVPTTNLAVLKSSRNVTTREACASVRP